VDWQAGLDAEPEAADAVAAAVVSHVFQPALQKL